MPQLPRCHIHQPLEREIKLRPAKAAHQARRRLVGDDDAIAHGDMGDVVGAIQIAMHPIERGRLWRTQIGATVLELIIVEREEPSVSSEGAPDGGDAVGRRRRGAQVLEPVFQPSHGTARLLGGHAQRHDQRKHRLLDAIAAA